MHICTPDAVAYASTVRFDRRPLVFVSYMSKQFCFFCSEVCFPDEQPFLSVK